MPQAQIIAGSRKIVPASRFRLEIDGIGNLRLINASELKTTFSLIETEEGGANTTAEITTNTYKHEPLTVERPLTDDTALADWFEEQRSGKQVRKNGQFYAMDPEGNDVWMWPLYEIQIVEFSDGKGDAKAKEEQMVERAVLRYREKGKRQVPV